jgi:hypothetical protein
MALALVKHTTAISTGVSPLTGTFTSGNTNGNIIIVPIWQAGATTNTITGVSDTEGNTYVLMTGGGAITTGIGAGYYLYYGAIVTAGAGTNNVITVTNSNSSISMSYCGAAFSGLTTLARDTAVLFNSAVNNSTYNVPCTAAGDLVIMMTARTVAPTNSSASPGSPIFASAYGAFWFTGVLGNNSTRYTVNLPSTPVGWGSLSMSFFAGTPPAAVPASWTNRQRAFVNKR